MNRLALLWQLYLLKKNERLSRTDMLRLQREKLRALLEYAWDHSPYYREVYENAGFTRERLGGLPLSALPPIDKHTLMENFDRIVTAPGMTQARLREFDEHAEMGREPMDGGYHVVHSSGSTGRPCYFLYDEAAWRTMLLGIIRGALWHMGMGEIVRLLAGRPRVMYIAAVDGRYGGAMAVGDGLNGVGAKQMHLDVKLPLERWAGAVRDFRPNILIGYPSAMKILATRIAEEGVPVNIVRVISCGEPLDGGMRTYLEEAFGAPVVNIYGASESLALGVQTQAGPMTLFDDLNVIEIEDGRMYLTCLYNYAQPLIRYQITDRLQRRGEDGPFSAADILIGRSEDVMWFTDGAGRREFLHPLSVEGFCIDGLRDYQFRQTGEDSFELIAEVNGETARQRVHEELTRQLGGILAHKQLGFVRYSIRFTCAIMPDPRTGKKPLIVRDAADDLRAAV